MMPTTEWLVLDRCWSCGTIEPMTNGLCDRCRRAIAHDLQEPTP